MPLIAKTIPNLIGGVSQQPQDLRLPGQADASINCYVSPTSGLGKRPPALFVAETGLTGVTPFTHMIDRDAVENYMLLLPGDGTIKVFDVLDGTEKTVNAFGVDEETYMTVAGDPRHSFRAVTTKDYTFLVNKETTVDLLPDTVTGISTGAAAFQIKATAEGVQHSVTVNLVGGPALAASFTSLAASTSEDVAISLHTTLDAFGQLSATRDGSAVRLVGDSGSIIESILVTDGLGNLAYAACYDGGTVQTFSDLPATGVNGMKVKVVGEDLSVADDYWVTFTADPTSGVGVWEETVGPDGTPYKLDPATMPHQIVRESNGTFTVQPVVWADRSAGDNESAPPPSFVDRQINDLFILKTRLGFISDEFYVLSEVGNLFNFWPTSVLTLLDSDRIDLQAPATDVSVLNHAVPYSEGVFLFSDRHQFILRGNELLTPKTASAGIIASHSSSAKVHPVVAGLGVFFSQPGADWSTFRELTVTDTALGFEAPDISLQVPSYVPSGLVGLLTSDSSRCLFALDGSPDVYLYQWLDTGSNQRVLSAWHKWTFDGDVVGAGTIRDTLYTLQETPVGDLVIQKINLSDQFKDVDADWAILLDRRTIPSGVYDAMTDQTTFTLPYALTVNEDITLVVDHNNGGTLPTGLNLSAREEARPTPYTVSYQGDLTGDDVVIGTPYNKLWRFSEFNLTSVDNRTGALVPETQGRLQLRNLLLTYANTGYFTATNTNAPRAAVEKVFNGVRTGSALALLGSVNLGSGTFKIPINGRNTRSTIELNNNTHLPSNFLLASWEGFYHRRNQGV